MVSSNSIIVTREKAPAKKQAIVREVLADLPEWFGLPASTQEYIDAAATLPLWVAKQDNQVIGFIDLIKQLKQQVRLTVWASRKLTTTRELAGNYFRR